MKSRKMDVPEPIWRWLHTVKDQLKEERGRTVTLPESWEHIKASYELFEELGPWDRKGAGR